MKLDTNSLGPRLSSSLDPIYLISGDEPLLVSEAADSVRARARESGFTERQVLFAEQGFDWGRLTSETGNLSLFGEKKLLELRLLTGKPGNEGSREIVAYAENPPDETILLVLSARLDSRQLKSNWVKSLEQGGVHVQIRSVGPDHLAGWIVNRMRQQGLEPRGDAAALLADRVEGNLLAANQEIQKLKLLAGRGPVDGHAVREAVADSARFDVFRMIDAALAGDAARALRIIDGLRAEGVAAELVLWAIAREVRQLAVLSFHVGRGETLDSVAGRYRVWASRKNLLQSAMRRHDRRGFHRLLGLCLTADLDNKGRGTNTKWETLTDLLTRLCGRTRKEQKGAAA